MKKTRTRTRTLALLAALTVGTFVIRHSSFVVAQGPLTPPGAPAPTMKTLDQLEARTPISTVPFTITQPGSYYLTGNVSIGAGGGTAITILASDVTLDLNGFTISSSASPAAGVGVLIGNNNTVVKSGIIRGTTTFSAGTFTRGGFLDGIQTTGAVRNIRISDIHLRGLADAGIDFGNLATANGHVHRCSVNICGGLGIRTANVRDSSVETAGATAILADSVVNCTGKTVGLEGNNSGINATSLVENSIGVSVAGAGIVTGQCSNSSGTSTDGTGLSASNAINCRGVSTTSLGVSSNSATGCRGTSSSGTGLSASTVSDCRGESSSGTGLIATTAANSIGSSSSGTGLSASTATNCFGSSSTGPAGIDANPGTASFCRGSRSGGIAITAGIAIGCTVAAGTVSSVNKFLGTP